MSVIVEIHGDTAEVHPINGDDREDIAVQLLAAAKDRRREIRTITGRTGAGFAAPVDIVRAAGLIPDEDDKGDDKPARKPSTRSTKAKTADGKADEKTDADKSGDEK